MFCITEFYNLLGFVTSNSGAYLQRTLTLFIQSEFSNQFFATATDNYVTTLAEKVNGTQHGFRKQLYLRKNTIGTLYYRHGYSYERDLFFKSFF